MSPGFIWWVAVSRPVTLSTALATGAGALADCTGARSARLSGPLKLWNVTLNALAASLTEPLTATYPSTLSLTDVTVSPSPVSHAFTAAICALVGPNLRRHLRRAQEVAVVGITGLDTSAHRRPGRRGPGRPGRPGRSPCRW